MKENSINTRSVNKILSVLMIIAMIIILMPMLSTNANAQTYEVSDKTNFLTRMQNVEDGDIIILTSDITFNDVNHDKFVIKQNCFVTLDLNSHILTLGDKGADNFGVAANAALLIKNGSINKVDTNANDAGILILNNVNVTENMWLGKTQSWLVNNTYVANLAVEQGTVNPGATTLNPISSGSAVPYNHENPAPAMVGSGTTWECPATLAEDFIKADSGNIYKHIILLKDSTMTADATLSASGKIIDLSEYTLTTGSYALNISNADGENIIRNGTITGNVNLSTGAGSVKLSNLNVSGDITNSSHEVTVESGHYHNISSGDGQVTILNGYFNDISGGTGMITISDGFYKGTLTGDSYEVSGGYFVSQPNASYIKSGFDFASTTKVENSVTYYYKVGKQEHVWVYSVEDNVLKATCSTNACELNPTEVELSINSIVSAVNPGSSITFGDITDGVNQVIELNGLTGWQEVNKDSLKLQYSSDDGSTWINTVPASAGNYKVRIYPASESTPTNYLVGDLAVVPTSGYAAYLTPYTINSDGTDADTNRPISGSYTWYDYATGSSITEKTGTYEGLKIIIDGVPRYYYTTVEAAINAAKAGKTNANYVSGSNPNGAIVQNAGSGYANNDSLNTNLGLYTDTITLLADTGTLYNLGAAGKVSDFSSLTDFTGIKYGINKGIIIDMNGHSASLIAGGYIPTDEVLVIENGTVNKKSAEYGDAYDDEGGTGYLTGTIILSNMNFTGRIWASNHSFIFLNGQYDIIFGEGENPKTVQPRGGYYFGNPGDLGVALDYGTCHVEAKTSGNSAQFPSGYSYRVVKGAASYNIQLDVNAGADTVKKDGNAYSGQTISNVLYEANQDLPTLIVRDGYTFKGWCTTADGTGTTYTSPVSKLSSIHDATVTLYAKWISHTHNWSYAVSGSTMTATCGENGSDCSYPNNKVSFTINTDSQSYTYDGTAITKADLFSGISFATFNDATNHDLTTDDIILYASSDSTRQHPLAEITSGGNYIAVVSIEGRAVIFNITVTVPQIDISTDKKEETKKDTSKEEIIIETTYTVKDKVATVDEIPGTEIDKVVEDASKNEITEIKIDVSNAKSDTKGVIITKSTAEKIETVLSDPSNEIDTLIITTKNASVSIDSTALSAIVDQATGNTITLVVEDNPIDSILSPAQMQEVSDINVIVAFEGYFESNGVRIHDFNSGIVEVSIGFTPAEGTNLNCYRIYYVPDNGAKERMITGVSGDTIVFLTSHFSEYVIVYDENDKNESEELLGSTGTGFIDVSLDDYFLDAIKWAVENGITKGTDKTHFSPMNVTTRAEMITFLWRMAGSPVVNYAIPFTDISEDSPYIDAIRWGTSLGYVKGTSATAFSPDLTVTRAQAMTFLARMANITDEASGYSSSFADVNESDYYNNAVAWGTEIGIIQGMGDNRFAPNDNCIRGQVITMIYRYSVLVV